MSQFNTALVISAGAVLVLGLLSGYVKNRFWISETAICLLLGIIIGPQVTGLVAEGQIHLNPVMREVSRITLGIAVMGAALRLPPGFVARQWRDIAIVLGVGMPLMWLSSSAVAWFWFDLPILPVLLIGAVLAPTDPVIAGSVVTGKTAAASVPSRLTNTLSAESGANDGLGLLFVMVPVLLITHPLGEAWRQWLLVVLLWEVLAAVIIGLVAGWIAGHLLHWVHRQPWAEPHSTLTVGLALSLTVLAGMKLLGSDGILAVFAAGVMFNQFISTEEARHERLQEAVARFFTLPVFILIGATLPWSAWHALGWPALGFAVTVLLLRRLPWWLLLQRRIPAVRGWRDAALYGWFGPIGVGSVYYAALAGHELGQTRAWEITSLAIFASVILHGVTATPLSQLYARSNADRSD